MTIKSDQASDRDPQPLDDAELEGVTGGAGVGPLVAAIGVLTDVDRDFPYVAGGHGGNGGVGGNGGAG